MTFLLPQPDRNDRRLSEKNKCKDDTGAPFGHLFIIHGNKRSGRGVSHYGSQEEIWQNQQIRN